MMFSALVPSPDWFHPSTERILFAAGYITRLRAVVGASDCPAMS